MSVTEFGYCPRCEQRVELVMTSAGVMACHKCGSVDIYNSEEQYVTLKEDGTQW